MIQKHFEDFGLMLLDRPKHRPPLVHVIHRERLGICAMVEQRPDQVRPVKLNAFYERIGCHKPFKVKGLKMDWPICTPLQKLQFVPQAIWTNNLDGLKNLRMQCSLY